MNAYDGGRTWRHLVREGKEFEPDAFLHKAHEAVAQLLRIDGRLKRHFQNPLPIHHSSGAPALGPARVVGWAIHAQLREQVLHLQARTTCHMHAQATGRSQHGT